MEKKIDSKKRAAEIAKQFKVKEVFENSKQEFFTSENLAVLSEGGKKENVFTHTFSGKPDPTDDEKAAAKAKAALLEKVAKVKKAEELDELLKDVTDEEVLKAGADKKAALEKK